MLLVLKFIASYLTENPLCIIFDEIVAIKKLLGDNVSDLKLKQKTSSIVLTVRSDKYYFKIKPLIPEEYPEKCLSWEDYESNLPIVLIRFLNGQSKEIARQCVEPPLRQKDRRGEPFKPGPSLLKTLKFIIEATRDFC